MTDNFIPVNIKRKTISTKKLVKVLNQYLDLYRGEDYFRQEVQLRLMDLLRFVEQKLEKPHPKTRSK